MALIGVQTILQEQKSVIDSLKQEATDALDTATSAVQEISFDTFTPSKLSLSFDSIQQIEVPEAPKFVPIETGLEDISMDGYVGAAPEFQDVPDQQEIFNSCEDMPSDETGEVPSVSLDNKPSPLEVFNDPAPDLNIEILLNKLPKLPAALSDIHIDIPDIKELIPPVKPQIIIPEFNAIEPGSAPEAPTDGAAILEDAYRNINPVIVQSIKQEADAYILKYNPQFFEQMDALESKISSFVRGESGLSAATENQYYERVKDKNAAEFRRARDTAYKEAARRGFTIPNGAVISNVMNARQAYADNNNRSANEVAIKQAELQQERMKFGLELSGRVRDSMRSNSLQYFGQLTQLSAQSIDYAKSVLNAVIEVYNAQVKAFTTKMELYRTHAEVYKTRLQSALSQIEIYKAEIDAMSALANVDRVKLDVYKARVDVLQVMASVHRAQIDAVVSQAQIEKTKLDVFEQKVRVHQIKAESKKAEWDGYMGFIKAQEAGLNAFGAKVNAYNSKIQAWKAKVEASMDSVKAAIAVNSEKASNYRTKLEGYKAIVEAKGKIASVKLENQRQEVVAYQAQTSAVMAQIDASIRTIDIDARNEMQNIKNEMDVKLQQAALELRKTETIADKTLHIANIYGNAAATAMSGIIGMAQQSSVE